MRLVRLTRREIAERIYAKTLITRAIIQKNVDCMIDLIVEALKKEGTVLLTGFGAWEVKEKKQRYGRDPQNKLKIMLPAHKTVVFRISKKFRAELNDE